MSVAGSEDTAVSTSVESPPLVRVRMIRQSLACFAWGCLGLVPGLGLLFALRAWMRSAAVLHAERSTWNPARGYRVAGVTLARAGILLHVVAIGLLYAVYS